MIKQQALAGASALALALATIVPVSAVPVGQNTPQGPLFPFTAPGATGAISPAQRAIWRLTPQDFAVNPATTCQNFANDDTTSVQAAINFVENAVGPGANALYVDGQCKITSTVLVSKPMSIICPNHDAGFRLATTTPGTDVLHVGYQTGRLSNFHMEKCNIQSLNADATNWGLQANNVGILDLENVFVFGNNTLGNGINETNFFNTRFTSVQVANVLEDCYGLSGYSSAASGAQGFIGTSSLGTITGGTGGTPGSYFNVPLTGRSGGGAYANIVVGGGGNVTSVTMVPAPISTACSPDCGNYVVGDTLSAASGNIGGVTGFSVNVTSVGIGSTDWHLNGQSRCDGGAVAIAQGPWTGGIYVSDDTFFSQSTYGFQQTFNDPTQSLSSYHFNGDDFDTQSIPMLWTNANDANISGTRFGYATGSAVLSFLQADILNINGNNFVGNSATECILLGSAADNVHVAQHFNISGNNIAKCSFGVYIAAGATNGTIDGNTFSANSTASIDNAASNSSVVIGANSYDGSNSGGVTIAYNTVSQNSYFAGTNGPRLLGTLRGANFNTTADQAIELHPNVRAFDINKVTVTNCSTSMTTAQGGIYPAASKGGSAIVASGQAYSAATSSSVIVSPTITGSGSTTRFTAPTIFVGPTLYLSLTTPQGAAATCDVYLYGDDLS